MSMSKEQAIRLGALIASARAGRGFSIRRLADRVGVHVSWIGYLEQGRYLDPAPDRVADVLGIEPKRIDNATKGAMSDGLPSGRAYFRAKYALTADEADQVVRYIERLRKDAA